MSMLQAAGSFGSPGSEVASQVHQHCFDDLDNYVHRVHTADVPAPYAFNLEQEYLPIYVENRAAS